MMYRAAFSKRVNSDGADAGMHPSAELDRNLTEGVVADKLFVEQLESNPWKTGPPILAPPGIRIR
jgi:hypothetical protein